MKITDDILYVGVNDRSIDLFEGQYAAPNGMAYNSYVILDKKIAVMDTVDAAFRDEWLAKLKKALCGRQPDYLVVQHMEPDHSANILAFAAEYPAAKIVSSSKSFIMMKNFFGDDFADKQLVVGDGSSLDLGTHRLVFVAAPMVHWPEVVTTYDQTAKTLFSADAFGKFGATDVSEDWVCEARRYYFGIVGKYGAQVQALLKKLSDYEIKTVCPLHGPVLSENIDYYLKMYDTWSRYETETEGVVIAYTSVYGNTKRAVELLAQKLGEYGCERVTAYDLARCDMSEALEGAFRYGKLVLATTTYNGEIFPFMRDFISRLVEHNFQNRTVGFIENGSWSPTAARTMRGMLEKCKNITYAQATVKIFSALTDENRAEVETLAKELCQKQEENR